MSTQFRALTSICLFVAMSIPSFGSKARLADHSLAVEIDTGKGALTSLASAPISGGGGCFAAYDFGAKQSIPLAAGKVSASGDKVSVRYEGGRLVCDANYLISKGNLYVQGTLKDLSGKDRAVVLSYTIPLASKTLRFSPSLNESVPVSAKRSGEGSVYPIAAMCGDGFGLAMAIPPSAPCMFRLAGSTEGLTLRLYLGLSPDTKRFPSSARFSFMVYTCDPEWGFRDAARRYYATFPEYYTHHGRGDGLWLFQSTDPPNLGDFLYDEIWVGPKVDEIIQRDNTSGILSFPYMIVGQREIKRLETLPASYERAMAEYQKWVATSGVRRTKESIAAGDDAYLKDEVESSAIKDSDGKYLLSIRNTDWGGNSVTFTMNPNPDLLTGKAKHTTGGDAMIRMRKWLADYPSADGIYIDSLGSNWCARLNFRHDHFPYAKYPLTFDATGNVALHNQISHYEFLAPLRAELHKQGKLLMANGVYCYSVKTPEYADVKDTGRFFLAALCDVAGAESSAPSQERWEFYKTAMGRKPYLILKYHWEKPDNVQEVFNQALCYGVFVTNSNGLGKVYWTDPNGYARDKALYEWYVPLVRKLSKAGWHPISYASSPTEGVRFERYGDRGDVYFTIYNAGPERECVLRIEAKPLGLNRDAKVEQISGPGFIAAGGSGSTITVRTKLASKRTAVIHLH